MYTNYIFDLYGTLADIRTDEYSDTFWNNFAAYLKELDIEYSADEVHELYAMEVERLVKEPTQYACPEIDIFKVFAVIARNKKTSVTDTEIENIAKAFRKISTEFFKLYDNTVKVLESLKKAGKKVYLLSNAQSLFTRPEIEAADIVKYFDDIFISSEAGCKKPDPAFFKMLIDKHQLDISKSIMIGNDDSSDIAGAKAVGLDAMYLRTAISPQGEPTPNCRYVFEDGDIGHVLDILN